MANIEEDYRGVTGLERKIEPTVIAQIKEEFYFHVILGNWYSTMAKDVISELPDSNVSNKLIKWLYTKHFFSATVSS